MYARKPRKVPTDCPKCEHSIDVHTADANGAGSCQRCDCDYPPSMIAVQRIEKAYSYGWDDGYAYAPGQRIT